MSKTGNQIKGRRVEIGLTQAELALRLKTTSQVVSNWERNYSKPTHEDIVNLSEVLEVSTDYLLIENQSKKTSSHSEDWITEIMSANQTKKEAMRNIWNEIKNL